jgi:hypothetical protein
MNFPFFHTNEQIFKENLIEFDEIMKYEITKKSTNRRNQKRNI